MMRGVTVEAEAMAVSLADFGSGAPSKHLRFLPRDEEWAKDLDLAKSPCGLGGGGSSKVGCLVCGIGGQREDYRSRVVK